MENQFDADDEKGVKRESSPAFLYIVNSKRKIGLNKFFKLFQQFKEEEPIRFGEYLRRRGINPDFDYTFKWFKDNCPSRNGVFAKWVEVSPNAIMDEDVVCCRIGSRNKIYALKEYNYYRSEWKQYEGMLKDVVAETDAGFMEGLFERFLPFDKLEGKIGLNKFFKLLQQFKKDDPVLFTEYLYSRGLRADRDYTFAWFKEHCPSLNGTQFAKWVKVTSEIPFNEDDAYNRMDNAGVMYTLQAYENSRGGWRQFEEMLKDVADEVERTSEEAEDVLKKIGVLRENDPKRFVLLRTALRCEKICNCIRVNVGRMSGFVTSQRRRHAVPQEMITCLKEDLRCFVEAMCARYGVAVEEIMAYCCNQYPEAMDVLQRML